MRRKTALLLLASSLLLTSTGTAAGTTLTDIETHWARTWIESGVQAGYVAGYPDHTFRPDAKITRAEFVRILTAATRIPPSTTPTGFGEERPASGNLHWSFERGFIGSAVANGLIDPADYGASFGPDQLITRREMVMAICRALGKQPETRPNLTAPDAGDYPSWLQGYAAAVFEEGVISGYEDGSLGLNRTATRAETLSMIQRLLDKVTPTLLAAEAPAGGTVRHPGEAEPYWSWTLLANGQTRVSAGGQDYLLPEGMTGLTITPAPGKAAWATYTQGSDGVVARLGRSSVTEMSRTPGARPRALAVSPSGRLWYTDGVAKLIAVSGAGETVQAIGITEPLRAGAVDWAGRFWGIGATRLYRATIDGEAIAYETGLTGAESIRRFTLADDGTAWLIADLTGAAPRTEAIQIQFDRILRRFPLGAPSDVAVLGSTGPSIWVSRVSEGSTALYRLDTHVRSYARAVLPVSVVDGYTLTVSPDGGAMVRDVEGRFWRPAP